MEEFIYESILYEKKGNIATITLNRPEKHNAMNQGPHGMPSEILHACKELELDPAVKVVIVKGAGPSFSSGYDIDPRNLPNTGMEWEITPFDKRSPRLMMDAEKGQSSRWIEGIWKNRKPFIAQVHGYCLAGGMDLASTCDILICSDDAVFGYPAVRYTSIPTTPVWAYLVGFHKAKEMVLTGNHYSAKEMYDFGLVNKVVPREKLEEEVNKLGNQMTKMSEVNQYVNKMWVNEFYNIAGLQRAIAYVNTLGGVLHPSRPQDTEFFRIREEKGLKAALAWMNAEFGEMDEASKKLREKKSD